MLYSKKKVFVLGVGVSMLAAFYILQQVNVGAYFFSAMGWGGNENALFVVNKTSRLLLNDAVCFAMIYTIFPERESRQFGLWVFVLELFFVLPVYFFFKLRFEGTSEISSPLLSFIHRLIVNPMLMILAMVALGYQNYLSRK